MVICLFVYCHKRTDRDLDCIFYRVPKVITNQGEEEEEQSRERRERWIAAINRKDLDEKKIDDGQVCNRHFVYGKKLPRGIASMLTGSLLKIWDIKLFLK